MRKNEESVQRDTTISEMLTESFLPMLMNSKTDHIPICTKIRVLCLNLYCLLKEKKSKQ